jgi:uncharacterized membrane protein
MRLFLLVLSFIAIEIFTGRKCGIPYGIGVAGFNTYLVLFGALAVDLVQIPIFYSIFEQTSHLVRPLAKLRMRIITSERRLESSRFVRMVRALGNIGVMVVTAWPFGLGGMWSGVLLAHALRVNRRIGYILLTIGSITGCFLFVCGSNAFFTWLHLKTGWLGIMLRK